MDRESTPTAKSGESQSENVLRESSGEPQSGRESSREALNDVDRSAANPNMGQTIISTSADYKSSTAPLLNQLTIGKQPPNRARPAKAPAVVGIPPPSTHVEGCVQITRHPIFKSVASRLNHHASINKPEQRRGQTTVAQRRSRATATALSANFVTNVGFSGIPTNLTVAPQQDQGFPTVGKRTKASHLSPVDMFYLKREAAITGKWLTDVPRALTSGGGPANVRIGPNAIGNTRLPHQLRPLQFLDMYDVAGHGKTEARKLPRAQMEAETVEEETVAAAVFNCSDGMASGAGPAAGGGSRIRGGATAATAPRHGLEGCGDAAAAVVTARARVMTAADGLPRLAVSRQRQEPHGDEAAARAGRARTVGGTLYLSTHGDRRWRFVALPSVL
ncbi:hypothetical protein HDU83_002601 [Entophlyctis luteolus]|nr:hypothetical protein HDU82_006973 [Entophlyctis luteolus]KAJ3346876.1 hypothetical protein HDU83_002601 [Entophlyctis luteolus]KAJ3385918.1 hypothetical protein HDU84_001894 [Entophlyctis sp. JEL0112]